MLNTTSILAKAGYTENIVTVLSENEERIQIEGEVYVQQIKELFNVTKWSYTDGKAEFYITK